MQYVADVFMINSVVLPLAHRFINIEKIRALTKSSHGRHSRRFCGKLYNPFLQHFSQNLGIPTASLQLLEPKKG
jgi:hypothetical protein